MTDYIPKDRPRSRWLLDDGSIIEEPRIEQSPAGRNVRIVGQEERVSRHDLGNLIYRYIYRQAQMRPGRPVPIWNLHGDPSDPEDEKSILQKQVGLERRSEEFEPFGSNANGSSASWVFKHPSLPLYARIVMRVQLSAHQRSSVECGLVFPNISKGGHQSRGNGTHRAISDVIAYQNEDPDLKTIPVPLRKEMQEILHDLDLPWGARGFPNNDAAMAEAIRAYRRIDSLSEITIPDLRDVTYGSDGEGTLSTMTLDFLEAWQPNHYLQEMQEYVESLEPASLVVEHWQSIVEILRRHGVQISRITQHQVLSLLTNDDREALIVGVNPLVRSDRSGVEFDPDHSINIDLFKGIIYTSCAHRNQDTERDLLAYELAKERAAITGETDLLEAFMASVGQKRANIELSQIIQDAHHA